MRYIFAERKPIDKYLRKTKSDTYLFSYTIPIQLRRLNPELPTRIRKRISTKNRQLAEQAAALLLLDIELLINLEIGLIND